MENDTLYKDDFLRCRCHTHRVKWMNCVFDPFSVKSYNSQLSRLYNISYNGRVLAAGGCHKLQSQGEWGMAPAPAWQRRQLWSRQSPEPEPERRTLSWSQHSPLVSPTDLQRTSDSRSHPSPRFVTLAEEHLWLFSRPCFYFSLSLLCAGAAVTVKWLVIV